MPDKFRAQRYADEVNPAVAELGRRQMIRAMLDTMWTMELAVVVKYHFDTQRVDLELRRQPGIRFLNIPILNGLGGGAMAVHDLKTVEADPGPAHNPYQNASVGVVLFPRTDATSAYDQRSVEGPVASAMKHQGLGPMFLPVEALMLSDTPPPALDTASTPSDAEDLDVVQRGDSGIAWDDGSFFVRKRSGKGVFKFTELYLGDKDAAASGFKAAARQGDDVGGVGATSINGGSAKVFISD